MNRLVCHIVLLYLLFATNLQAQSGIGRLYEELPNDSIAKKAVDLHTALKPAIRTVEHVGWRQDSIKKQNFFFIAPAVDAIGAYNSGLSYRLGAGVNLKSQVGKWYFKLGAIGGLGSVDSFINTPAFYYEKKGNQYVYSDIRARIGYTPNEVFNFQVGLDNHFIGEGSRSLFLSDYGTPFPFAQIRTKFWRVEYTVLYQFMREHTNIGWKSKYATTHHLSFNAAKWLNFGIFETVLFEPKDTLLNRGYDAEYLNPIIFLRPQEYAFGSADNVLIGLSMDVKFGNHMFYTQGILDEFSLKELKNNPTWWANKFGGQAGFKGRFSSRIGKWFYRVEYNMMRPYTYAHVSEMQAYGNQGHALAHPLGANFHEILTELKWQQGKWLAKFFTTYRLKGEDKDGYSYGGDIYQSYVMRPPYEYGHKIGQGIGTNVSRTILTLDYEIWKLGQLHAFIENHFIINGNTNQFNYVPVIGIRSQLWNDYRNY